MPHFRQLKQLITEVSDWADLRFEQGAKINPVIKRLERDIKYARKLLRKAEPTKKQLKKEPNALDAIKLVRPDGPRRMWDTLPTKGLANRMKGAWLGRAAGCTLGAPVEFWAIDDMEALAKRCKMPFPPKDYWTGHNRPDIIRYLLSPVKDYLKPNMSHIPVDDDLTYTLLGLLILEEYGPTFTVDDVGKAWTKFLPMACTAEDVALKNLKAGIPASEAGGTNNPYQEWIGADIRSDPWAYAAPGWPEKAAEFAYRDAYLSHRQNGIYGEMFFSAAISAAFAVDDPIEALRIGLTEIPKKCRLAKDVKWALEVAPTLKGYREAREAMDARFPDMSHVHTNNNACLTIFGLIMGQRDFTKTIGLTVAMGMDNDCTAATAGSLLGAVMGAKSIPEHWWKPFKNKTRTYMTGQEWFSNTDIVNRFIEVAKRVYV